MAKRRRLDPTSPMDIALAKQAGETVRSAPPPIAQVTGEAAAVAAAQDALSAVETARAEGRLVITIPIAGIARDHLTRDRLMANDEDMEALKASIKAHGQRTPIEVVELAGGLFGLISGWRRLAALEALGETEVKALIRTPKDAGAAYVAMVEENEIRVGLSYYERARIAVMAASRGAFEDVEAALSSLYGSASRAKRSKIRSFVSLHEALGDLLQFPAAIPERLGLALVGAIKAGKGKALRTALRSPAATPEAEAAALARALSGPRQAPARQTETFGQNLTMEITGEGVKKRVILRGSGLTDARLAALRAVLKG